MEKLYDLKEKLLREVEEIGGKSKLTPQDVEAAHVLTNTIKNIDKICMLEESGHSQAGPYPYYEDGNSYGHRGQHLVRSHYSHDGGMRRGMGGYPDRGYSRGDERSEMMEHLEMALETANEKDREAISRMLRQMEKA